MPCNFKPSDVVNKRYPDGRTPLHMAVARSSDPVCGKAFHRSVSLEMLSRSLLHFGADINARDNQGRTPLHLAAARGNWRDVEMLLAAGADPNAVTIDGDTALYVATFWEHVAVIRLLLRWGADASIANTQGKTPLAMAIQEHKPSTVISAVSATRCCPKRLWFFGKFSCLSPNVV